MTREIKFRVPWDVDCSFSSYFCYFDNLEEIFLDGFIGESLVNWERAQQYTGLKDKNGKEIYEGDILRDTFEEYEFLTIVEWWDIGVWGQRPIPFRDSIDYYTFAFNYNEFDKVEVIGNIYENLELLNVK